jgi:two-component system NtrC family sensor kinase
MSTLQPRPAQSYERAFQRERLAKKQAEEVLERRSRELFEANQRIALQYEKLQHTHDELKLAQTQLIHSERMASVGQLAAGIAHEINNPMAFVASNLNSLQRYTTSLTSIVNTCARFLESIRNRIPTCMTEDLDRVERTVAAENYRFIVQDIAEVIQESKKGAERITDIVTGLRNFSRLDEEELKAADLNEGIQATLKIAHSEIRYRCSVITELGELPEIMCHPGQLNQVFLNLIMNAVQACQDNGRIEIRTYANNTDVFVDIEDNGCGIADENLSAIFTPFFTTKPVGEGTGLGLSISYAIVKKHGGDIRVRKAKNTGSIFTVLLPIEHFVKEMEASFTVDDQLRSKGDARDSIS